MWPSDESLTAERCINLLLNVLTEKWPCACCDMRAAFNELLSNFDDYNICLVK